MLQIERCNVTIKRCEFNNNSAAGNSGVLQNYLNLSTYAITLTSFTNNRAGENGGAMYIGVPNSQITIGWSILAFNQASSRGGAIDITGCTLTVIQTSIYSNSAKSGGVASACKSNVNISNPKVHSRKDLNHSFCTLYDSFNTTTTSKTSYRNSIMRVKEQV